LFTGIAVVHILLLRRVDGDGGSGRLKSPLFLSPLIVTTADSKRERLAMENQGIKFKEHLNTQCRK
jgi:hypothetical protein